jgi:DNA polymerase III epsilon subunit-like protein
MSKTDINVMLDIETLSKRKTAAIVSIAAVKFTDKEIIDYIYININPLSCKESGLDIQLETLEWWKTQKVEAWNALKSNRFQLKEALAKFSEWFGPKSLPIWANAPSFDCTILENAYQTTNLQTPWSFYHERCFRTFKAMFKSDIKLEGIAHNALDDARYQANYIISVMNNKK